MVDPDEDAAEPVGAGLCGSVVMVVNGGIVPVADTCVAVDAELCAGVDAAVELKSDVGTGVLVGVRVGRPVDVAPAVVDAVAVDVSVEPDA